MGLERINAVLLSGGINRIPLFEGYEPGYKALVPFRGRPSIQYSLDALRAVPRVGKVCIVGSEADLRPALRASGGDGDYDFVAAGETLLDSVAAGLRHFASSKRVLVLTADMPLITPQAITDFLEECERIPATDQPTLYVSVVPRSSYTGPYVRFTKPFNHFRDVAVCHGNLWLADPRLLGNTAAISRINRIYNARKNPLAEALAVGSRLSLAFILGVFLLHALTLKQMTHLAARRFGVAAESVLIEHPEITIDVDEPDDYQFVVEQMAQ